jgi:hypothetical protein
MAFPLYSWCKIQINYPDNLFRNMIFFDYLAKKNVPACPVTPAALRDFLCPYQPARDLQVMWRV